MPYMQGSLGFHHGPNSELEQLRACGEIFLVDALKRRPNNGFAMDPEDFEKVRRMATVAVDTQTDMESVFTDFGFIVRPEIMFW